MRKFFSLTLVIVFCLSLIGCQNKLSDEEILRMAEEIKSKEAVIFEGLTTNSGTSTLPISLAMYHQLYKGMTYNEVVGVVADYGIAVTEIEQSNGSVLSTLKWNAYKSYDQSSETTESFVICKFENDILIDKVPQMEFLYWDTESISLDLFLDCYPNASSEEYSYFKSVIDQQRYAISELGWMISRIPSSGRYRINLFLQNDPERDEAETPYTTDWQKLLKVLHDSTLIE